MTSSERNRDVGFRLEFYLGKDVSYTNLSIAAVPLLVSAVQCLACPGPPAKLHVRARVLRFARKFNGDLCITAPCVQVRTK